MKLSHLDRLSGISGIPGDESAVAEAIIRKIDGYAKWERDSVGTLFVYKEGKERRHEPMLVMTHMDEVGLLISHITDDGYLQFVTVGEIDSRVLPGRQVLVGENALPGVISCKAIHQTTREEREKPIPADKLLIDIGAANREEAEKLVKIGDSAVFLSEFERLGGRRVKGKALDARIGCAILISLIRADLQYDTVFAFTTRHHTGGGESFAAYTVEPAKAVVIGGIASDDLPGGKGDCALGKGGVLPLTERRTRYDRTFSAEVISLAAEKGIALQTGCVLTDTGTGLVHHSRGGVPSVFLGLPCRYMGSPAVVADEADMEAVEALALALIEQPDE